MRKIKVIQLVEDLKIGGLERVIATIAEELDREKYDVEVWCIARGGVIADELKEEGIGIKILGIFNYHNPINILKLVYLLKKHKPDIVHTHGYFASVIGRISAKLTRTPIIINHVHSTYWNYKKKHIFMERTLGALTDKVICCSKAVQNFVIDYEGIEPSKIVTIHNGVDEEKFPKSEDISRIKEQLKIDFEDSVVGTVSSLVSHKGHQYLLQAAKKVLKCLPKTKFLIVGGGCLKDKLEKQSRKLGIFSQVIFTGIRNDIPELLSIMDVFVLPSCFREGLSLSIMEAMASGKAVVATNIGGIPEMVKDGVTGILVPPRDANSLAKALISLLKDKDKAKKMGEVGQELFKKNFTSEIMIDKLQLLYSDLLKTEFKKEIS